MCIIVDANVGHEFYPLSDDARVVYRWLQDGNGVIVVGGRVRRELFNTGFRRIVRTLQLAGRLFQCDDAQVDAQETKVGHEFELRSDDPHVIALARVSRARVLFSRDQDLHADFCNGQILNKPRGRVYQNRSHEHLLRRAANVRSPEAHSLRERANSPLTGCGSHMVRLLGCNKRDVMKFTRISVDPKQMGGVP
jgi:hypothetical protein